MIIMGGLAAVPALVSILFFQGDLFRRLAIVAALLLVCGLALSRLRQPQNLQWNESLVIVGLLFTLTPLLMAWPLIGLGIAPVDAWLETVSAVTTTGLTTLRGMSERPGDFLFLRAWMQWYGGLGIAVLTMALVARHHPGARRLLESTGESLTYAGAREHARRVFLVYCALTLLACGGAWASGLAPFSAIVHALAAIATGGFAVSDRNLAVLPTPSVLVLSVFSIVGAIGLPLYARMMQRGPRVLLADPEARALLIAVALTTLTLAGIEVALRGSPWSSGLLQGFVLAASAQTDTGFSATSVAALPPASQLVLMVSMTIGGSTGSTAGGIKLIRLLILLRLIQLALRRTAVAERAVLDARVGGERVEPTMITGALQLLGLWALVVLSSWIVFLLYGEPAFASLFEIVSATANAGLSVGLTAPGLASALKLVLTLDMLFGRVEILALLVLIYPRTWIGRRTPSA